jgi:hypothetical protein
MQVTFTNASSGPVYIGSIWMSLDAGQSVTTRRTIADLDRDQGLKVLVQSSTVTLAFAKEVGDDAFLGFPSAAPSYSNTTRPAASTVPVFTMIFNTDDHSPNFSDGTQWRDAAGNLT